MANETPPEKDQKENSKPDETEALLPKSTRKPRKKELYNKICKQVEFYFSDANITKDRYMGKLIGDDVTTKIPISEFLKFNKVRSLTESVEDIVKSLKKSNQLEVSDCRELVGRKHPLQDKDVDACTIYAENLPPSANHDWVSDVFNNYGNVVYISLPRYKSSGKLKLFGFIEFETPEMANKALKEFDMAGCCLDSLMSPDDVPLSIKTYEGDQHKSTKVDDNINHEISESDEPFDKVATKHESGPKSGNGLDSDKDAADPDECDSECSKKQTKGIKLEQNKPPHKRLLDSDSDDTERTKKHKPADDSGETSDHLSPSKSSKKKKKRKRKRKQSLAVQSEVQGLGIKIMSKVAWKKLRNKYLNEQKTNMRYLKRKMYEVTHYTPSKTEETDEEDKNANISFIPNVIVKLETNPVVDCLDFKKKISGTAKPAYIDVEEGRAVVYVRFHDSEGASQFLDSGLFDTMSLCSGEEEKNYWDNILVRQKTRRRLRGRKRMLDKADKVNQRKHIYFE